MSTSIPRHSSDPATRLHLLPYAVAASVVQMLIMIPGYSDNGSFQAGAWLTILAISLVVSVLLFAFVVPVASPVVGVIVAVVALVSVLVFWAGVTLPLAAAAGMIGWQWLHDEQRRLAVVALVVAGVATIAMVAIVVGDAVSN